MINREAYKQTTADIINSLVCTSVVITGVLGLADLAVAASTARFSEIDVTMQNKPKPQYYNPEVGIGGTDYYLSFKDAGGISQTLKVSDGFLSFNESDAEKIYNAAQPGGRYKMQTKTTRDFLGLRDRTTIVKLIPN